MKLYVYKSLGITGWVLVSRIPLIIVMMIAVI